MAEKLSVILKSFFLEVMFVITLKDAIEAEQLTFLSNKAKFSFIITVHVEQRMQIIENCAAVKVLLILVSDSMRISNFSAIKDETFKLTFW